MRVVLALLFFVLPTAVSALSCMPYNAVAGFKDAAKSPDDYVAVLGKLTFDERKLPKVDWERQQDVKPDNHLTGRIEGKSLTRSGFDADFARDIDINVQCFGPWCGGLAHGVEHLVFLKREDGRYLLETNPCGGFAFGEPDRATLQKVKGCMQGKRCDPDLPQR
ncbi:hypothetical protein [Aliiroseovarius marinus]|uniref:hypothetical protein n=1 Tax=Aliiroseovarius marinus TaxID=2500159 RepID=UPI003D7DC9D2